MEIQRAKTLDLLQVKELDMNRQNNTILNKKEALSGSVILESKPQRLVLELTNQCNLKCVMCGRNSAEFNPTYFDVSWLDLFDSVVKKIEEVTLMGWGEPTIHPQFDLFLEWAYEKGLRKYFCTNGMLLDKLLQAILDFETDIIAISLDGSDREMNNRIRKGSDFDKITRNIEKLNSIRTSRNLSYPYNNIVFTAMHQNIHQLPDVVRLAKNLGMDEVKVVFYTVMDKRMISESLWDKKQLVVEYFNKAIDVAKELNIKLKLPYVMGEDPAGSKKHRDCYVGWRDLFVGSDGYIRPCMSTGEKMFHIKQYNDFESIWNSKAMQLHRGNVNNDETMSLSCNRCYQSSCANWNMEHSFYQYENIFSPEWI